MCHLRLSRCPGLCHLQKQEIWLAWRRWQGRAAGTRGCPVLPLRPTADGSGSLPAGAARCRGAPWPHRALFSRRPRFDPEGLRGCGWSLGAGVGLSTHGAGEERERARGENPSVGRGQNKSESSSAPRGQRRESGRASRVRVGAVRPRQQQSAAQGAGTGPIPARPGREGAAWTGARRMGSACAPGHGCRARTDGCWGEHSPRTWIREGVRGPLGCTQQVMDGA